MVCRGRPCGRVVTNTLCAPVWAAVLWMCVASMGSARDIIGSMVLRWYAIIDLTAARRLSLARYGAHIWPCFPPPGEHRRDPLGCLVRLPKGKPSQPF